MEHISGAGCTLRLLPLPACLGLLDWMAGARPVLGSGEAALRWVWPLFAGFRSIAPCVYVVCCVCVRPPVSCVPLLVPALCSALSDMCGCHACTGSIPAYRGEALHVDAA